MELALTHGNRLVIMHADRIVHGGVEPGSVG